MVQKLLHGVEVKSGPDGFVIKTRDGKHLRCAHNNPQRGHLPNYAPHPAIVLKMEDGTGLLLPIIVLYIINDRISRVTPDIAVIKSFTQYRYQPLLDLCSFVFPLLCCL